MSKYKQLEKLTDKEFRRLTGVKRQTFSVAVEILSKADAAQRKKGGPKPTLCVEDRLLLALEYLREYRTYFHIGRSYGLSESQAIRIHRWVEEELIKDRRFHLPGRKKLLSNKDKPEVLLIDATESPIERPKKKRVKNRRNTQKHYYSGKKKGHTLKTQLVTDKNNHRIICVDFCHGRRHDFHLFKESGVRFQEQAQVIADTGYQGLQAHHENTKLPKKSSQHAPLKKSEKSNNRDISSKRTLVENIIGMVKRFRILSERYRNRRKRFGLRFNLISAIYNFEL